MRELLKSVKEKLASKYYKNETSNSTKKFKPRLKARIRKNKQILNKKVDTLFDWIKGARLVELTECNTDEDPVRPELDIIFRRSYSR